MTTYSNHSETVIANMAIDILDDMSIDNIDTDTSTIGRFMRRNFAHVRNQMLQAYPWVFARARASLPRDGADPDFGWDYRYALPTDYLATVSLTADGELNAWPIKHEREGDYILTDQTAPLYLRYTKVITNPMKFPPLFAWALAARLALFAAQRITGKSSYVQKAAEIYKDALEEARLADSLSSGTQEDFVRHDIVEIRGVGL